MAVLIELKRLKDLKIVGMSSINGNIKLDGTETPVYTHPTTHNADMIVDGTINKAYTSIEKTKLANIKEGTTKVETSTINGNIKIDGVESPIYSQPLRKLNRNWVHSSIDPTEGQYDNFEIIINKNNMSDYIYINKNMFPYISTQNYLSIILSDEVRNIDNDFVYELVYDNSQNFEQINQEIAIYDSNGNVLCTDIYGINIDNTNIGASKGKINITKGTDGIYYFSSMSNLDHVQNIYNPHKVTAKQVGLINVPNICSTVFAGKLNNSLLTLSTTDVYINYFNCVEDKIIRPSNTYITFTTPFAGTYEFDGRCTSQGSTSMLLDVTIGTGKLIKITNKDMPTGETIRFNQTLMYLPVDYTVTLVPNVDTTTLIDNVHFTIKYLGAKP